MHIISRKRLNDFAEIHPESKAGLRHRFKEMKKGNFSSIEEVRSAIRMGNSRFSTLAATRSGSWAAIHYIRHVF